MGSGFIYVRTGIEGIRKDIATMSKEKDRLVEENRVLHRELATLSSPARVISLAQAQGLSFPQAASFRTLALAEPPPEPRRPRGPATAGTAARPAGSPLSAFLKGLLP